METTWPEKLRDHREKLIRDLLKGRDFAHQLQNLFQEPTQGEGGLSAEELVVCILRSFTDCLSLLTFLESGQIPVTSDQAGSTCFGGLSQDSGHRKKRSPPAKDRRGGCRRRRLSQSWMVTSSASEDEYAWRKYGQKQILNAQYPRCYYRCTHKYDQGCKATKQVQKIEGNQSLYRTTYFGYHTCNRNTPHGQKMIAESVPAESNLFSSETKILTEQYDVSFLSMTSVKEEFKEETQANLSNNLSSLDSSLWSTVALESLGSPMMLSPNMASNHEDAVSSVFSCASTSSTALDMEDLIEPADFGIAFDFDEI